MSRCCRVCDGQRFVAAHHSLAGVYDMKVEKEVTGTVAKIQFVNPHGSMTITVKNPDGRTTDWIFTTGSATRLADRGIGKGTLKAGETITATFIPASQRQPAGISEDRDHGRRENVRAVEGQP